MEENKVVEEKSLQVTSNIEHYQKEISKLEVSKLDASSNYQKAEIFMLDVIKNEDVSKEDKIEIGKQVTEKLLLSDEQKDELSQMCKIEYSKTKQGTDEYFKNLLDDMADDSEFICDIVPCMDYTKEHGLNYMAIKRNKKGKTEKYFVSSKKDTIPYEKCEEVRNTFKT